MMEYTGGHIKKPEKIDWSIMQIYYFKKRL